MERDQTDELNLSAVMPFWPASSHQACESAIARVMASKKSGNSRAQFSSVWRATPSCAAM